MNYRFAADVCSKNAIGHANAAYLLRANSEKSVEGAQGYAVFHACVSFEEACKAAWCALVATNLLPAQTFKTVVHRWHHAKTYLFVALTRGGIIRNPQDNLLQFDGQDFTPERFKKIKGSGIKATRRFESDRQAGLYVDIHQRRLESPLGMPPVKGAHLVYRYVHRMGAMLAVCDRVLGSKPGEYVAGIKVTEVGTMWNVSIGHD